MAKKKTGITDQWWGNPDGLLHRFEGWGSIGRAPIRTSMIAACGWPAPAGGLMEGEENPSKDRQCLKCSYQCGRCGRYPEVCLCV